MQTDLVPLLRGYSRRYPARIVRISCADRDMRWTLRGDPWWRGDIPFQDEAEITFIFKGIESGLLDLTWHPVFEDDEILELFDISRLAEHEWARPRDSAIYAYAPLPDPLALYARIEDYLWEANASKTA